MVDYFNRLIGYCVELGKLFEATVDVGQTHMAALVGDGDVYVSAIHRHKVKPICLLFDKIKDIGEEIPRIMCVKQGFAARLDDVKIGIVTIKMTCRQSCDLIVINRNRFKVLYDIDINSRYRVASQRPPCCRISGIRYDLSSIFFTKYQLL